MPPKTPSAPTPRKLVAFDFDGTLTYRDSFTAFLQAMCGNSRIAKALAFKPGIVLNYIRTKDRGALKSHLLYNLLGAVSQEELETQIKAFVTRTGMSLYRPDALKAWEHHDLPDRMRVIVTASPDLLVRPFAELIGADRVIGTRLGFSADGRLLPDLNGANCRGPEKVRRIKEAFGESPELIAAYGDTSGDSEMLALAEKGYYRVFKQRP